MDPDLRPNAREADFEASLSSAVVECMRRNIKDFNFRAGIRNIHAVGPWPSAQELGEEAWELDGIHIPHEGRRVLDCGAGGPDEMAERCEATVRPNPGKRSRDWEDPPDRMRGGQKGLEGCQAFP